MKQENYNISRKHATTVQRSAIAGEPLGAGLSFWREIADNLGSMRYDRLSMRASVFALGLSQIVYPPRPGAADETIAHMVWDGLTNSAVYGAHALLFVSGNAPAHPYSVIQYARRGEYLVSLIGELIIPQGESSP